ncbi:MAG: leucyl aminopeptidase [Actinomycetales bacterium]|nr:leucyl aminopeptidase [Actinomycetales bacterium]
MTLTPTSRIVLSDSKPHAAATDALVVGLAPARGKKVEILTPGLSAAVRARLADAFVAMGAKGTVGEVTRIPGVTGIAAPLVVGLGLGDESKQADAEALRRAVGDAVRSLAGTRRVALALPLADDDALLTVAIAAQLAAYDFVAFRQDSKKDRKAPVHSLTVLLAEAPTAEQKKAVKDVTAVAQAVNLTRDLVNTPPNALPPAALANAAAAAVEGLPVEVTIWDELDLVREECGGILAVGQGSTNPPRLTRLAYSPEGATAHLALVGKGITFDTGGISIKPAANMDEMKSDMAGAAAVIGAVSAIASLGLPVRVTGWVPSAENMPSGTAQRPGDVIRIRGGKTVEVLNTDAEGRLILADAIVMAAEEKPDLIIDIATLTGAAIIALGARTAGVMSNDDDARASVVAAAGLAGETVWPMPLPDDLRPALDSGTADIANIGDRKGGMLSAGVFLREFVPAGQPWVHIDIAGPSFNDGSAYGYTPKGGTGSGVRTFVQVAAEMAQPTED